MHVLAVDDDDRELFEQALKRVNPQVHYNIATDGIQALEYLNKQFDTQPDFIFMDVNMPKMGGKECLALLKANNNFNGITVVMYSTTQSREEIAAFTKMGAMFLQKPSNFNELVHSLKKMLGSKFQIS
jgi:DNA-binding response OmpR family regulator